jgi:hypothetical protein
MFEIEQQNGFAYLGVLQAHSARETRLCVYHNPNSSAFSQFVVRQLAQLVDDIRRNSGDLERIRGLGIHPSG